MPDDALIDDFLTSRLKQVGQQISTQPATNAAADVAAGIPKTSSALESLSPEIGRIRPPSAKLSSEEERSSFIAQNRQGEVPLDVDTGAGIWNRLKSSFMEDEEQKVKFWQGISPYVRPALKNGKPTGGLIMRVMDEQTQQPKDVLVDEQNVTAKDWAEFATSVLPETIGFVLGTRSGKKIPAAGRVGGPMGGLRDLLAGTIGAETIGGLADIPAGREGIAEKRLEEGIYSLPVGAALGLFGKLLSKATTPFGLSALPEVQQQGREAQRYMAQKFGETFEYSAGQKTGNLTLQRFEAQTARYPGASSGVRNIELQQESAASRIINRMIGLPADATAAERAAMLSGEEVGEAGIGAIRRANQPLQARAELERRKLVERSQQRIEQDISNATTPTRQVYNDKVGLLVRNRANQLFQEFKTKSDDLYEQAKRLPGGRDRILDTPSLSKEATDYIKNKLPSVSGEPLKPFLPPDVLGRLQALAESKGAKWSLEDLVSMRSDVNNAIKAGEAVPGVQTHHLNEVHKMLTKAIDEGTSSLGTPALKNAWKAANDFYAQNVGKFQTKLASAMRKEPTDPGYVGPAGLVKRIVSGEDNILEAKQFLGAGSKEYAALRRGIADDVFQNALYPGSETLNAQAFVKSLSDLRTNNRRAFDETFGSYGDKVIQQAKEMLLGTTPTAKIDAEAALMGIRNPSSVPRLRDMIQAEKAKDVAYQNEIRKAVGSNTLPGDLKPSEFVQRFLSSSSPKEAKAAMDLMDDATRWKVRAKMVENILAEAARSPTSKDAVIFRLDPQRIVAADKLTKIIGDPERQRMLESVLGAEKMEDLKQFAKLVKPIEAQAAEFRGAGGIQAGMAIGEFERGGVIPFMWKAGVNKVISFMLTVPGPKYVGNTMLQERGRDVVLTTVLSSTPFTQSLIEELGQRGAEQAGEKLGQMFGTAPMQGNVASERPDIDQFLQRK